MRDLKRIVKSSAEGVTIEVSEISGQFLHGTQRGRSKNGPHQPPIGAFRRVTERRRPIPRAIWALGFASLLMDVSSELIHSRLPVFMFTGLGVSTPTIGLLAAMIAVPHRLTCGQRRTAASILPVCLRGSFGIAWGRNSLLQPAPCSAWSHWQGLVFGVR